MSLGDVLDIIESGLKPAMSQAPDLNEWIAGNDGDPFLYGFRAEGTPYVKVGYSRDPFRRLDQVQSLAPQPLILLGLTPGGSWMEARVHQRLAPWRHRGEWFDIDAAAERYRQDFQRLLRPWELIRLCAGFAVPDAAGIPCVLAEAS